MRRSWWLLVDGRSGDVVVGGALDDMVVVLSVLSLKGNVYFLTQLLSTFCCSLWRGDEGSPKKTERNDFFSCGRGLLMLTGRRYQKTSSPLAEGWRLSPPWLNSSSKALFFNVVSLCRQISRNKNIIIIKTFFWVQYAYVYVNLVKMGSKLSI